MSAANLQQWLLLAAALHFVQLPAMAFFRTRVLELGPDLHKLTPINQRIVQVLAIAIVLTVLGLGLVVLLGAGDLARGSRLALGLCVFLGLFWLFRAACQLWYTRLWPVGPLARFVHWALFALFAVQAAIYLLVANASLQNVEVF